MTVLGFVSSTVNLKLNKRKGCEKMKLKVTLIGGIEKIFTCKSLDNFEAYTRECKSANKIEELYFQEGFVNFANVLSVQEYDPRTLLEKQKEFGED